MTGECQRRADAIDDIIRAMSPRNIALFLAVVVLAGCKDYEGRYSPGCIAYAGSNVTLVGERFTWEKYTDQVVVDDRGNSVNQFPGYPVSGSYNVEGKTVYLVSDAGESLPILHVLRLGTDAYLLTTEQFESWEKTNQHDVCALMRE